MPAMQACTTVNVVAGLSLFIALAFAGCGNNKPDATAPGAGTAAPGASAEPKADTPAGDKGDNGDDGEEKGDKGDDGEEKGDKETRTTEVIQQIVQDNRKGVRDCYDKAKKNLPTLAGTMTIHFVLDPDGKVSKAELNLERSEIKASEVANCAIEAIKKMKFPPSSRGMQSEINYPFSFKP